MADDVPITAGAGTSIATDDIGGVHYQKIKIVLGLADAVDTILDSGQQTSANSLPVVVASDQSAIPVSGTVAANAGTNLNTSALALEAGGNLAAAAASLSVLDDWDETDRAKVNPIAGQAGVQGASGTVTALTQRVVLATDIGLPAGTANIGDVDVLTLPALVAGTANIGDVDVLTLPALVAGSANIGDVDVVGGLVAHDAADSGNPVKVGARAVNVLTAVSAADDRSDLKTDLSGRLLVTSAPVETRWSVNRTFTAAQTGTVLKTPTSGKKLVVTSLILGSYGTTAGRCILFFDSTTTFTQDTDQALSAASFAPSSTSKPGLVKASETLCLTVDLSLRITTDAALSIDVTVEGYEV